MQTKAKGWVLTSALIASAGAAAFAQDTLTPSVTTIGAPGTVDASMQGGMPEATPTTTGTASGAGSSAMSVGPGPMEAPRKILLSRIQQAKSEGIGIASYMNAFTYIEDAVKSGQTEAQVRPRIESLARALKDQLDKSRVLKTQRPAPPTASQTGGGAPTTAAAPATTPISSADIAKKMGGGGADSSLIDKIKERFGGQLPDINSLPEGLRDKLINSDKGKELLKKLGK